MSTLIGIVCEDHGHFFAVTHLVDAALIATHRWLDGILDNYRSWRGLADGKPWYKYDPADAYDLRPFIHNGVRIPLAGHINGQPLKPEAGMWRKALLLFVHSNPRPNLVVLVRDMDGYATRSSGLTQVRDGLPWPFDVVVATPEPEVEAWHVCGFEPRDAAEQKRLKELTRKLSFNPVKESHRLTSHPNDADTDAKRVLEHLCDGDPDRREACLDDPSTLRARGTVNGLTAFLDEVDQHIVPVFAGR